MFSATHAFIARLDADKLEATPHVVPQPGLLRSVMGDDAFLTALDERRRWIADNCKGAVIIVNMKGNHSEITGKLYRFESMYEASFFKIRF